MIVRRCFRRDPAARTRSEGGPLWFPRAYQGSGRHDNPEEYGCLYVTDTEVSAVVEQLARFRGSRFLPRMLERGGQPLALAAIDFPDDAPIVDLDDPRVLVRERLRPSLVATGRRETTQRQALDLYRRHAGVLGLRWWSVHEATWVNLTLFDRARLALRLVDVRVLAPEDPSVEAAADYLGMR